MNSLKDSEVKELQFQQRCVNLGLRLGGVLLVTELGAFTAVSRLTGERNTLP